MVWLNEKPEHANSDLGLYWRMAEDIGLHNYGRSHAKFVTWGYLPHEGRIKTQPLKGVTMPLL